MKSELRNRIEVIAREYAGASARHAVAPHGSNARAVAEISAHSAWSDLSAALDSLDSMAERDALWGKMEQREVEVGRGDSPNVWASSYKGDVRLDEAKGNTALAAVQALVAKIEATP